MRDPNPSPPVLEVLRFSVFAKDRPLLRDIELRIPDRSVFAIVGPSGIGKTTLLRSLNRLTDLTPDLRREGDIRFRGESIHDPRVNPDSLRARVGILFQQPVVFPGSILHNVLFGVRHVFRVSRRDAEDIAERALRDAALWAETRDRLHAPAARLSVGQQQRARSRSAPKSCCSTNPRARSTPPPPRPSKRPSSNFAPAAPWSG
jgi:phosphate transport system ATP-binding protein